MNKEQLIEYLNEFSEIVDKADDFITKSYEVTGIEFIGTNIWNCYQESLDLTAKIICESFSNSKESYDKLLDTLFWFFYEYKDMLKSSNKNMCKENAEMWDNNGNPMCYDINSLANYFIEYENI